MDKKASTSTEFVNCACVIHSNGYSWDYVDRLYNMLNRNLSRPVKLHVYTEESRSVPDYMVKHVLDEWPGIAGPKQSWWYKLQLFNTEHYSGDLLYFDLDTVIINNVDWITHLSTEYFWSIHDFKRLVKPRTTSINSSVMWWNTERTNYVWQLFEKNFNFVLTRYHGDQEYITDTVLSSQLRYFDLDRIVSWRWQVFDGGLLPGTRQSKMPGTGAVVDPAASIIVFHGTPKPHEITEPIVLEYWK
jgi:hypothetical protein